MQLSSLKENIIYNDNKPAITVLLKNKATKEIRIVMKKGQVMKNHSAPYPIVVEVFDGHINFGVDNEIISMTRGSIIALEKNVTHNLTCLEDCIVRLSLSVLDTEERVKQLI